MLDAADESAIRSIPQRMADGWNDGNAEAFAAPFADDADFVAFEGTHLVGREAIVAFHQQIFETIVKGSRLEGVEVKFIRALGPTQAVVHARVRVTLPEQTTPLRSRDSMQLLVLGKHDAEWRIEALQNSRILTIDRQFFLDELEFLSADDQRKVADLVRKLAPKTAGEPATGKPRRSASKR